MQAVAIAEIESAILGGKADGQQTTGRTEPCGAQGIRLVCCRCLGMWLAEPDASKSRKIDEQDRRMASSKYTSTQAAGDLVSTHLALGNSDCGLAPPKYQ